MKPQKQVIISIGREFGSAGHEIAERIAKRYGFSLYDHNLLREVADSHNVSSEELEIFDEMKHNKFLYRTVKGMSSSPADNVALLQFNFLREKAEKGDSFVVVGRCSETILREYKCLVSIFVGGDISKKAERVMKYYNMTEKEAREFMKEKDKRRKQYHNRYCEIAWGDSRNYDLSINSSRLGIDGTIQTLIQYIDARIAIM